MEIEELVNNLHKGSMSWNNYGGSHNFDAAIMNYMSYMGDSAMGYDGNMNYGGQNAFGYDMPSADIMADKKRLASWLDNQVSSGTMTTYRFRVVYTAGGGGSHGPVDITLFAQALVTPTFSSGNVVFTNSFGDTATLIGMTKNLFGTVTMEKFYFQIQTQPFMLGFMRMRAKSEDQLSETISIIDGTQYGGSKGNNLTPDDYIDPDQYQFLRVDVPFNVPIGIQQGLQWTVDEDQTGKGINIVMFIPTTHNPSRALQGKDMTSVLNAGVMPQFYVPNTPTGAGRPSGSANPALIAAATNPAVQAIITNGSIPRSTGQALIRNLTT